ncbi:hypothetical protein D0Y65_002733 [Glycine soja]|uniref:DUF1664 domain-containing protein n=1 Tax=Glycine soja TaxID=3848 RepID=A0A445LIJ8_GLYSO|nr:hypothetical protein D0Y65_002733 [Glycine soja]
MAMAMQSGIGVSKILIIAGAGYTSTVLIKTGKLSDLIGELQLLVKGLEKSGEHAEGEGEYADAIAAQVRRLANEVRQLASNRPITVLNGGSEQSNLSSLVVPAAALGALGYGYMWWKGISFSDLMYVTKRNMEKAVADLTKKLQHASDVIADTKKHLTQRIQNLNDKMLKLNELQRSTKDEVAGVRSTITDIHEDLGYLQQTVETLDYRLAELSSKQDYANYGLSYLIDYVHGKSQKKPELLQGEVALAVFIEVAHVMLSDHTSDAHKMENEGGRESNPLQDGGLHHSSVVVGVGCWCLAQIWTCGCCLVVVAVGGGIADQIWSLQNLQIPTCGDPAENVVAAALQFEFLQSGALLGDGEEDDLGGADDMEAVVDDFEREHEQLKLSGKSPNLITYKGTPNLMGLKDIAETLSASDRSASDSVMPDGMDKREQQRRPLLRNGIAKTLSGLDKSALDSIMPNGVDKLEQL